MTLVCSLRLRLESSEYRLTRDDWGNPSSANVSKCEMRTFTSTRFHGGRCGSFKETGSAPVLEKNDGEHPCFIGFTSPGHPHGPPCALGRLGELIPVRADRTDVSVVRADFPAWERG